MPVIDTCYTADVAVSRTACQYYALIRNHVSCCISVLNLDADMGGLIMTVWLYTNLHSSTTTK